MTADDRTYVLRLLRERRASLVSRSFSAKERCDTLAVTMGASKKHGREHAHLVSLEAELFRCDEVIAAVEAMP